MHRSCGCRPALAFGRSDHLSVKPPKTEDIRANAIGIRHHGALLRKRNPEMLGALSAQIAIGVADALWGWACRWSMGVRQNHLRDRSSDFGERRKSSYTQLGSSVTQRQP